MNGQFPLGQINPFKYFFGLACFFAVLFTLMLESNGRAIWIVFGQWLVQTNGVVALFIGCHLFLSRFKLFLSSWQKLIISSLLATLMFAPLSLLIDVYIEQKSNYTLQGVAGEWLAMAPPAIACWIMVNLPWLLGANFNYSTKGAATNGVLAHESTVNNQSTHVEHYTLEQQDASKIQQVISEKSKAEVKVEDDTNKLLPSLGKTLATVEFASKTSERELSSQLSTKTCLQDDFTKIIDEVGRDQLISLKSELHYLSVITTEKEQLILYSLKDAIRLLETQYGLPTGGQVHRSYWVNQPHIMSLKKQGREGRLLLSHQYFALVSRSNMSKVKTWF